MTQHRILGIIAAFLCASHLCAQRCEHVVQRGEDFSSIAQKYGITEDELKASNPSSTSCYVGRKLLIPNPGEVVKRAPVKVEPFDYGLISSLGDSILTKSSMTTYQVGEALWKKQKYSQAMTYLSSAAYGGDARAYYPLADCYSQPSYKDHDDETAVTWYLKAVENVKDKKSESYLMPCLRLSKCYLTGTGVDKDLKQARLLYNEYSRHASQPYSAEARQLQRDIAAKEAEIAKVERAKRLAEQEKARKEKRRQEAERAKAAANKRAMAAASSKSSGGSSAMASSSRTTTSQRSVQSRPAATTQTSTTRKTTASSHTSTNRQTQGPQEWREDMGFGNFVIVKKYPNGSVSRTRYRPCPNCHLTRKCANCYGTGRCGLCKGQGGIITSGYGRYIPCYGCKQTGKCDPCKGTGVCSCTTQKLNPYPGYVVASSSVVLPDGTAIRNTGGYNGRDDKFTITPPGETVTTFDDTPSSGNSSSSSRRSSGSCSKCGGSGYDTTAYQCAAAAGHGARQPYHSSLGSKCPYCSSVIDHYHYACTNCWGKGHE